MAQPGDSCRHRPTHTRFPHPAELELPSVRSGNGCGLSEPSGVGLSRQLSWGSAVRTHQKHLLRDGTCVCRAGAETPGTSGSDSVRGRLGDAVAEMPASWCVRTKSRARQRQFPNSPHCGFCFLSGAWFLQVPAPFPEGRVQLLVLAGNSQVGSCCQYPVVRALPHFLDMGEDGPHTPTHVHVLFLLPVPRWPSEPFRPFFSFGLASHQPAVCHPCVRTSFPVRHSPAAARAPVSSRPPALPQTQTDTFSGTTAWSIPACLPPPAWR